LGLFISYFFYWYVPHSSHVLEQADENRPRHERRSCREDLDVRRSSDPLGRQASSYDHPAARRTPGGPLGMDFTLLLGGFSLSIRLYVNAHGVMA
jgi:hypothetical protein